ncbi:JHE-like carboxylesterase 1 [Penaeus vannamei]|uniref:JHE-like carboxylesterase 1 n=1 Tax=Penaeus vannamei TaxID=6689 RepID=A0A423SWP6_PENVA|nr:JHE-like carboxylesterase 1 [Penaeus vannamei]
MPPKFHSDALLPVIVAFHSGAFETRRHRRAPTSPSGFLSSEDAALPGNLGLKDQVMGLRWVQENIRNLGGDPDKVTILGSALGPPPSTIICFRPCPQVAWIGSLYSLAFSSIAERLVLCPWAFREDHRRVFLAYAHSLGCISKSKSGSQSRAEPSDTESEAVVECLRQVPLDQLLPLLPQFQASVAWRTSPHDPTCRRRFLQDHPATLLREGRFNKVSLISGVTTGEAGLYTKGIWLDKEALAALKTNFDVAGPVPVGFHVWEEDPAYLARRAFYRYMDSTELNDNTLEDFQRVRHRGRTGVLGREGGGERGRLSLRCDRLAADRQTPFAMPRDTHSSTRNQDPRFSSTNCSTAASSASVMYSTYQLDLAGLVTWMTFSTFSTTRPTSSLCNATQMCSSVESCRLLGQLRQNRAPNTDQSLGFRWSPASESDLRHLAINTTPKMIKSPFILKREFWKNLPIKNNKLLYPELFQACSERSPSQWLWTTAPGCEAPRD